MTPKVPNQEPLPTSEVPMLKYGHCLKDYSRPTSQGQWVPPSIFCRICTPSHLLLGGRANIDHPTCIEAASETHQASGQWQEVATPKQLATRKAHTQRKWDLMADVCTAAALLVSLSYQFFVNHSQHYLYLSSIVFGWLKRHLGLV